MKTTWFPFNRAGKDPIERWWYQRVVGETYALSNATLVFGKPSRAKAVIPLDQIQTWQIIQAPGIAFVEIITADGNTSSWTDRFDQLTKLLKEAVPAKELPWRPE